MLKSIMISHTELQSDIEWFFWSPAEVSFFLF